MSESFKCPFCASRTGSEVKDSRAYETWIRRRRKCNACGKSFTTYEEVRLNEEDEPERIKPGDILVLRALATEILKRTEPFTAQFQTPGEYCPPTLRPGGHPPTALRHPVVPS